MDTSIPRESSEPFQAPVGVDRMPTTVLGQQHCLIKYISRLELVIINSVRVNYKVHVAMVTGHANTGYYQQRQHSPWLHSLPDTTTWHMLCA